MEFAFPIQKQCLDEDSLKKQIDWHSRIKRKITGLNTEPTRFFLSN